MASWILFYIYCDFGQEYFNNIVTSAHARIEEAQNQIIIAKEEIRSNKISKIVEEDNEILKRPEQKANK